MFKFIISAESAQAATTWIFTDFLSKSEEDRCMAKRYKEAAKQLGVPFISVLITCKLDENLKRLASVERGKASHAKLTDQHTLRKIRDSEEIYRFRDRRELELDVTRMSAEWASRRILCHVVLVGTHDVDKGAALASRQCFGRKLLLG